MASDIQPPSDKESLIDAYLSSCSDTFKKILADHSLVQPLRRLILVGRLKYSNRNTVEDAHQLSLNKLQDDIKHFASRITGILIIHGNFYYHIVESSDQTLNDVIKATARLLQEKSILGAKVIRSCNIVNRLFNEWNSCIIRTPNYRESNTEIESSPEETTLIAIAQLIKKLEDTIFVLASFVRFVKPGEFIEKINELVPIGVLLFKKELEDLYKETFFLSVGDYIDRYHRMPEYVSFIEREWPPTSPVQDSKEYFDELERFEVEVEQTLQTEEEQKKKKTKPGNFWWSVKGATK